MTRICRDSTNPFDIPVNTPVVMGYVDGLYKWSPEGWAQHAEAVQVRLATSPLTDDGHGLDVERFDASPQDVPGWLTMRRGHVLESSPDRFFVYCDRSSLLEVAQACGAAEVPPPWYWVATLDGTHFPLNGRVLGCQFAGETQTGAHYDESDVVDVFPWEVTLLDPNDPIIIELRQRLEFLYNDLIAGVEDNPSGTAARLDRIEKALSVLGGGTGKFTVTATVTPGG